MKYEGSVTAPVYRNISLRIGVTDEYNSKPPEGTEKNDLRVVSSVVGSF